MENLTMQEILNEYNQRQSIDRPWEDYPIGTKAHAFTGGYWERVDLGWKWCTGATFPTPGGDAMSVTLPSQQDTLNQS